jgi:hypothetical protein
MVMPHGQRPERTTGKVGLGMDEVVSEGQIPVRWMLHAFVLSSLHRSDTAFFPISSTKLGSS